MYAAAVVVQGMCSQYSAPSADLGLVDMNFSAFAQDAVMASMVLDR